MVIDFRSKKQPWFDFFFFLRLKSKKVSFTDADRG